MKLYKINFEVRGELFYVYIDAENIRDAYDMFIKSRENIKQLNIKSIELFYDFSMVNYKDSENFLSDIMDLCNNIIDLSKQKFFDTYYIKKLANDADIILNFLEDLK